MTVKATFNTVTLYTAVRGDGVIRRRSQGCCRKVGDLGVINLHGECAENSPLSRREE